MTNGNSSFNSVEDFAGQIPVVNAGDVTAASVRAGALVFPTVNGPPTFQAEAGSLVVDISDRKDPVVYVTGGLVGPQGEGIWYSLN